MIKQNNNPIDRIKLNLKENTKKIDKVDRGLSKFYEKYKQDNKEVKSTLRSMNRIVGAIYEKQKGDRKKNSTNASPKATITANSTFLRKIDDIQAKVKMMDRDVSFMKKNTLPTLISNAITTNKELIKINKTLDKVILSRTPAKQREESKLEKMMDAANSPVTLMRMETNDNFQEVFSILDDIRSENRGGILGSIGSGAAGAAGGILAGAIPGAAGAAAAGGGLLAAAGRRIKSGAKSAASAIVKAPGKAARGAVSAINSTDPFFKKKWSRFLMFLARKAPKKLGQQVLRRLALSAGLATVPIAGWIGSLVSIGLSLSLIYEVYSYWEMFNDLDEDEQAQYDEGKVDSTEVDVDKLNKARDIAAQFMQVSEVAQAKVIDTSRKAKKRSNVKLFDPDEYEKNTLLAKSPGFSSPSNPVYDALMAGRGSIDSTSGIMAASGNASIKNVIETAAKAVGVDSSLMLAMARQESMFKADAQASGSSAKGLFQMTKGTWNDMVSKYSKQFPVLEKGVTDPMANAIGAALYVRENTKLLESNGIPVNPTSIYASHFLGPGGARILFQNDPNTPAVSLLPAAAASNPSIFYDSDLNPRTLGEVRDILYNKVGKVAEQYAANGNMVPELEGMKAPPEATAIAMRETSTQSASLTPSIPTPVGMVLAADNTSNRGPYAPPIQPTAGGVNGLPERANRGLLSTLAGGIAGQLVSNKLLDKMGPQGALLGSVAGDLVSSGLGKLLQKPNQTGELVDSGTREMERERDEVYAQNGSGPVVVNAPNISSPQAPQRPTVEKRLADAAVRVAESAFTRALAKDFSHPSAFTTMGTI